MYREEQADETSVARRRDAGFSVAAEAAELGRAVPSVGRQSRRLGCPRACGKLRAARAWNAVDQRANDVVHWQTRRVTHEADFAAQRFT
jgi:hypothetical protein